MDGDNDAMTDAPSLRTRLLIISGLSGAGRSTAADTIEDLGWYVVDNLPPGLLPQLYREVAAAGVPRLAVVLDVRSGAFFDALPAMFGTLQQAGITAEILFLDASDEVIVRRQESARRPLPLQGDGRLLDAVRAERDKLATLRGSADLVLDTSDLNIHHLAERIALAFGGDEVGEVRFTVLSFGFKRGIPADADMVVDVRFLPNPFWVPDLRGLSGLDEPVRSYVLEQAGADAFLGHLHNLIDVVAAGYLVEGKRYATIAIGCTGGKHRSTAMAEELARRLRASGSPATALHRDLGLE